MTQSNKIFCFCTLALGKKYRQLATMLAEDIAKYSPQTAFIVLTDQPQDFSQYPHVLAYEHQQQGVKCYHDKRFAISKSLSLFDACIFMDADMRILESVPEDMQWLLEPGIKARACIPIAKKFSEVIDETSTKKFVREFALVEKATKILNLEAERENIMFVHEYLMSVTKDSGKEIEFLQQWENLANYFESNEVYDSEGFAIGLAAHKAKMAVKWSDMPGITFFNNKTEIIRVRKGQSTMEEMSKYFEEHDKILYLHQPLWQKIIDKVDKEIKFFYRKMRIKFVNPSKSMGNFTKNS